MNERELIECIVHLAPAGTDDNLLLAMGDDCAVVRKDNGHVLLYSTDALVEKVHFDLAWHPPFLLGRKAVSVNVSDVAAMGGQPRYLLFSLGLPGNFDDQWACELCKGVVSACDEYGCTLIGGDTVASPGGVSMGLTVIGEMKERQVLYRSGAREGDMVLVSGPLGSAAAGLALCGHGYAGDSQFAELCRAHLDPCARVDLGQSLAASGLVHAMMDLSDGLGTDLGHICRASGLGALLFQDQLPAHPCLQRAAQLLKVDPVPWMTGGGEDYELLVVAPGDATKKLQERVAGLGHVLYPVGRMTAGKGIRLAPSEHAELSSAIAVEFSGYDHFNPE
jgi:thiamine-monophosphate kinase